MQMYLTGLCGNLLGKNLTENQCCVNIKVFHSLNGRAVLLPISYLVLGTLPDFCSQHRGTKKSLPGTLQDQCVSSYAVITIYFCYYFGFILFHNGWKVSPHPADHCLPWTVHRVDTTPTTVESSTVGTPGACPPSGDKVGKGILLPHELWSVACFQHDK